MHSFYGEIMRTRPGAGLVRGVPVGYDEEEPRGGDFHLPLPGDGGEHGPHATDNGLGTVRIHILQGMKGAVEKGVGHLNARLREFR